MGVNPPTQGQMGLPDTLDWELVNRPAEQYLNNQVYHPMELEKVWEILVLGLLGYGMS